MAAPEAPLYRLLHALAALGFAFTLAFLYRTLVAPHYAYMGFTFYPLTVSELLLITTFTALLAYTSAYRLDTLSAFLSLLTLYLVTLPTILYGTLAGPGFPSERLPLLFALAAAQILVSLFSHLRPLNLPRPMLSPRVWTAGFLLTLLATLAFLVRVFGLRPPPSPLNPYEVRLAARGHGALVGYLLRATGNVLAPTALARGVLERNLFAKLFFVFLGLATSVLVYSFDGTKSNLLAPFLVLGLALAYRWPSFLVILLGTLAILAGAVLDQGLPQPLFTSIAVRRLFFVPGLLTNVYYDYFILQAHPLYLYSHSFLSAYFENPYFTSPPFLLGWVYYGNAQVSANANYLADAIANLGLGGVPLVALIAGILVYLLRGLAGGEERTALLIAAVPTFSLANSALPTTILTHGLFFAGIVLWTFPRLQASKGVEVQKPEQEVGRGEHRADAGDRGKDPEPL